MEKIKNCPYCKNPPVKFKTIVSSKGCDFEAVIIECSNDDDESILPFMEHRVSIYAKDDNQAIERWNEAVSFSVK